MTPNVYGPSTGTPLLWLHGWMGHGGEGEALQNECLPGFQLVCPDLPGHGSRPVNTCTLEDLLKEIADVGQSCEGAIGYSMGGRMLMMAAARYPGAFNHLMIESSHPGLESLEARQQRSRSDAARAQDLKTRGFVDFCRNWYAAEMWNGLVPTEKTGNPEACADALERFGLSHQPDLRPWLRTTPTQILWLAGHHDPAYVGYADWVRNTTHHEVAFLDAGHNVHAQRPAEWGELVTSFFKHT